MLYTHGQVFVSSKFQRPVFTIIDSSLIQRQQLYLPSHGWAQVTSTNYPQSFYVLSLVMWQLFRKHPSCTGSKPCMHECMHECIDIVWCNFMQYERAARRSVSPQLQICIGNFLGFMLHDALLLLPWSFSTVRWKLQSMASGAGRKVGLGMSWAYRPWLANGS